MPRTHSSHHDVVVIRRWKEGSGHAGMMAVFPRVKCHNGIFAVEINIGNGVCSSYKKVLRKTYPATKEETSRVCLELKKLGYIPHPVQRYCPGLHGRRVDRKII